MDTVDDLEMDKRVQAALDVLREAGWKVNVTYAWGKAVMGGRLIAAQTLGRGERLCRVTARTTWTPAPEKG